MFFTFRPAYALNPIAIISSGNNMVPSDSTHKAGMPFMPKWHMDRRTSKSKFQWIEAPLKVGDCLSNKVCIVQMWYNKTSENIEFSEVSFVFRPNY